MYIAQSNILSVRKELSLESHETKQKMHRGFRVFIVVVLIVSTTVELRKSKKKIVTTEKSEAIEKESQENQERMLTVANLKFEPADEFADEVKEEGNFFQGDIDISEDQKELLKPSKISFRTGFLDKNYRWLKSGRFVVIPYVVNSRIGKCSQTLNRQSWIFFNIDPDQYANSRFTVALKYHDNIGKAIRILNKFTCIRFVPRKNQKDYVNFTVLKGCSSKLGRIGGQQPISLGNGCTDPAIILHEIIHTLGYTHMHNHKERDDLFDIKWENIEENKKLNFEKVDTSFWGDFGTTFDYESLMMYGPKTFSKNGSDTIVLKKNKNFRNIIGQRQKFSRGDQMRINNMYNCTESKQKNVY